MQETKEIPGCFDIRRPAWVVGLPSALPMSRATRRRSLTNSWWRRAASMDGPAWWVQRISLGVAQAVSDQREIAVVFVVLRVRDPGRTSRRRTSEAPLEGPELMARPVAVSGRQCRRQCRRARQWGECARSHLQRPRAQAAHKAVPRRCTDRVVAVCRGEGGRLGRKLVEVRGEGHRRVAGTQGGAQVVHLRPGRASLEETGRAGRGGVWREEEGQDSWGT